MIVLRFRSNVEHEDLLMKVKKMKKFTQELEECLEDAIDDGAEYRGSYRKDYDDEIDSRYSRVRRR